MAEDLILWFLDQFEKNPNTGFTVVEIADGTHDNQPNVRQKLLRRMLKGDIVYWKGKDATQRYRLNPQSANRIRLQYGHEFSMHGLN